MKDRIKKIRKEYKLTQVEFGERIGVKGNTITNYENGLRNPTDAVILSICREFNINENWLRTGTGEMYKEADDKLSSYVAEIVIGNDEFIKDLITVYMELDDTSKAALKKIAYAMAEKREKRTFRGESPLFRVRQRVKRAALCRPLSIWRRRNR